MAEKWARRTENELEAGYIVEEDRRSLTVSEYQVSRLAPQAQPAHPLAMTMGTPPSGSNRLTMVFQGYLLADAKRIGPVLICAVSP